MSLFNINAKLISHYPINFRIANEALATETSLTFNSTRSMPILTGQEFTVEIAGVSVIVTSAAIQEIVEGVNTIAVLPLPGDVLVGAETKPRVSKTGNEVEQTIKCEFLASLTKPKVDRGGEWASRTGGTDALINKYIGRIVRPKYIPPYLENGRISMMMQSGENVYTEGQFLPENTGVSRLGIQKILGDKIIGTYVQSTPARYYQGKVYDQCC